MKVLYFHVPKTAGSSINRYFSTNIKNNKVHIESIHPLTHDICERYDYIAGHVAYERMDKTINLNNWVTIATFREPLAYVISHLKWVRKLADSEEKERFKKHPKHFQDIAMKMLDYNFSNSEDIKNFIEWLESIDFYYFHNTQMQYMDKVEKQHNSSSEQLDRAMKNIHKIDYIGIQEDLDSFVELLSKEFGWKYINTPKININEDNYGFDIDNPETRKALLPLYKNDLIIYNEAKKISKEQYALRSIDTKTTNVKDIISAVDKIESKIISGWVCNRNDSNPIILELYINDSKIEEKKANISRMDLYEKKIHSTGNAGFRFKLKDGLINKKSKIELKVKGTDKILNQDRAYESFIRNI